MIKIQSWVESTSKSLTVCLSDYIIELYLNKKFNISYQEALKSGRAKQSYIKGGTNIFNPIDGFKVGYKFGHDTLGPALFGKK